jgi:hypothetical protein
MDEATFSLFFIAVLSTAAIGCFIVHRRMRKQRRDRIRRVAGRMGLHRAYHPGETLNGFRREQFLLLGGKRNEAGHGVENLLQGRVDGRQVYLFDFEQRISQEANASQSVLVIKSGKQRWPKFALYPKKLKKERFTQRMRTAVQEFATRGIAGYRKADIRIEGYRLSCPPDSEQKVRALFTPEIIRYFSGHLKFALEGSGRHLLFYQRERLVASHDLEAFIREAMSIHRLFESPADGSEVSPSGRRCRTGVGQATPAQPSG